MSTYRAVQLTSPGKFELVNRPLLDPPAGKVRIRVEACGICHSDSVAVDSLVPGITYPRVPGDFFPLDEDVNGEADANGTPGRWCFIIGDAAGHGPAAAVVMAIVQSVLHAHPADIAGPADLLAHANRQLCRKNIGGFFTAFLGIYDPAARRLTYAIAGHPPPLLKRASDGAICPLDAAASYPLGIVESETFKEATVQLESGDTVLLYTDGITEERGNPL